MALAEGLTKLRAVNLMLAAAGEQQVSTLVDDGINDTDVAQRVLNDKIIEVLAKGWDFNTVTKTISPTTANQIVISSNYLRVDGEGQNYRDRFTVRGNVLYDLTNDTDQFEEDVELRVTQNIEWDDIPSPVRFYIARASAREYQNRTIADPAIDRILQTEELMAWEDAKKHDSKASDRHWIKDSRSAGSYIAKRNTRYQTDTNYEDPSPR